MAKTRLAIVAVESNLIGRHVYPPAHPGMERLWKLPGDSHAEIVAVFVGDLDEGGALKIAMRGNVSGAVAIGYANHLPIGQEVPR